MSNAKKSRKTIEWETLEIPSRKLDTKRRFHANMGTIKDRKYIDLTECLMNYEQRFVTLYRRQRSRPSSRKGNAKKQNGCLRRPYK